MPLERPREAPPRWRLDRLVGGPRHGERAPQSIALGGEMRFPVLQRPTIIENDITPSDYVEFSHVRYTRRYWGCPAGMLVFYAFDEMTEGDVEREMWRIMMLGIGAELDE